MSNQETAAPYSLDAFHLLESLGENPSSEQIFRTNLKLHPEYQGGLSSHLPMTMFCLFDMVGENKIPSSVVNTMVQVYASSLEPMNNPPVRADFTKLSSGERKLFLGNFYCFGSWLAYYTGVFTHGVNDEVLKNELSFLADGASAAAAGQGILRIVFALRAKKYMTHETWLLELATAFAYTASRYLTLSGNKQDTNPATSVASPSFVSQLRSIPEIDADVKKRYSNLGLISLRQELITHYPAFITQLGVTNYEVNLEETLKELARVFTVNQNFELLHLITVGHALWWLEKNHPEIYSVSFLKNYAKFVVAVYMTYGLSKTKDMQVENGITASDVYKNVSKTDDDHVIKSAFALIELFEATGEYVFLQAAWGYSVASHS